IGDPRALFKRIFQAVELVRMENCPAQAVLPLVGLAADKITHDGYSITATEISVKPRAFNRRMRWRALGRREIRPWNAPRGKSPRSRWAIATPWRQGTGCPR
ncbi:MAG: hypothetical protein R6U98_31220, partial [Pirellulaceae bacterium]